MIQITRIESKAPDWPNPLARLALLDAVSNGKKKVMLNSRWYTIRYFTREAAGEIREIVFVAPISGFIPCGEFDVQKLKDVSKW